MIKTILQQLQSLADEQGFRIVYACETGSRGWGFASPDSDFDVRFVFTWPQNHYLSIEKVKDTITLMTEAEGEVLDFNGWELRKLLYHMSKSNATPFEWLQSPIIYSETSGFRSELMQLAPDYADMRTLIHHYLGICAGSIRTGVSGEQINIKKYFYVLRPLLAARWAADRAQLPPMEFRPLLDQLSPTDELRVRIEELWYKKEQAKEGAYTDLVPEIQTFIASEMARCKAVADSIEPKSVTREPLNHFFRKWINN